MNELADSFLEAQRVYVARAPLWDGQRRTTTSIRMVLPLPSLAADEEMEVMKVYAAALNTIARRGQFFGGDFVPVLASHSRQADLLESLCRPANARRQLERLLKAGMTYDHSMLECELRELDDPEPYLEGMRPFFELGEGDITAESGYPRLRNFHKLFDRNKSALRALANLPQWRLAFDEFKDRHVYSACPADWKRAPCWPIATQKGLKAYVQSLPAEFRR
jgi:hypothetical protein